MKINYLIPLPGIVFLILIGTSACTSRADTPVYSQTPGTGIQMPSVSDIIKQVEPAIVRVDVSGSGFTGSGSSFIVDKRGYLVTNYHVIQDAIQIKVTLMNGDSLNVQTITTDTIRDLALLKLSSSRTDFAVVIIGSTSTIEVGQDVLTAGFPLGNDLPGPATFNRGIISAKRTIQGLKYVQTDAVISG